MGQPEKKKREKGSTCCPETTRILKDILDVLKTGKGLERGGFVTKMHDSILDRIRSTKDRMSNYIMRDNPIAQMIIKTNRMIQATKDFLNPKTMFSRMGNAIKEKLGIGRNLSRREDYVEERITNSRRHDEMIKTMKSCCGENDLGKNKNQEKEEKTGFLGKLLGGGGITSLLSKGGIASLLSGPVGSTVLAGGLAMIAVPILKMLIGGAIDKLTEKTKEIATQTTDALKSAVPSSVASGLGLNTSSTTTIQKNIDNSKTIEEKHDQEKLLEILKEDKIRYEEAIKTGKTEEASAIRQKMNSITQISRNMSEKNNKSSTTLISESISPTIKELNDKKIKIENSPLYSETQKKETITKIEKKITALKQFEGKKLSQSESENVLKIYREMNRTNEGTINSKNTIKSVEKLESNGISVSPPISVSDPQSSITGDILKDVAKTEQEKSAGLMASLAGLMPGGGGANSSSASIGINHQNQTVNVSTPPPMFNGLAAAVAMNS